MVAPKPKVLQVLPALGDGGVERSTLEMAEYLHTQGWPNHVASAGGKLAYDLSLHGTTHHRLPLASKNPLTILLNALRLSRLIQSEGYNIVHVRSRAPAWSTWIALNLLHSGGKKPSFVATFHGTYGAGSHLKRAYNKIMLAGTVIANSAFIARHIAATYGYQSDKIIISPRGVDFSRLEKESAATASGTPAWSPEALSSGEGKTQNRIFKLLCVGRFTRWKGQLALVEAMAEVARQHPTLKWELAFAGTTDKKEGYFNEVKTRAEELGLASRIRWLGSRADVLALNAQADLAISPSLRPEAFGRAAVEAMAMGTPVVATRLGGSIETIIDGKTGWLVDVAAQNEDVLTATHPAMRADVPQALAKIIAKALTEPARLASMGQDASRHVRKLFTSEMTCAAELAAYRKALGLPSPAIKEKRQSKK